MGADYLLDTIMLKKALKTLFLVTICVTVSSCSVISDRKDAATFKTNPDDEYFAHFVNGQKNGYSVQRRIVESDRITITERELQILRYRSTPVEECTNSTIIQTVGGKPMSFEKTSSYEAVVFWFFPVRHSETIAGIAKEDELFDITKTTNGKVAKHTIKWPEGAVLSVDYKSLFEEKGLKEGTAFTVKQFDYDTFKSVSCELKIGPVKEVDVLGTKKPLIEIVNTYQGSSGSASFSGYDYIDQNCQRQKTIVQIAGMKLEEIACSRDFALSKNVPGNLTQGLLLSCPVRLKNYINAKSISYLLEPVSEESLVIPTTDYQLISPGPDGNIMLTVRPVRPLSGVTFPYQGNDETALEALKPSKYLQSDNEKIIKLAHRAIGKTKDAAKAAKKIERFVYGYIRKKEMTLARGFMPALEIIEKRKGDCKEHAVLTAAMCRAVGIPAQVVTGYIYTGYNSSIHRHAFSLHAWTQAYIGDKWIGLDSPRITFWGLLNSFTAGHIAIKVCKDLESSAELINLVAVLGQFKIKAVKQ